MATTEDYFSIDDILSAEPRLYCTFRVRAHNLGHLDPIGVQAAVMANPSNTTAATTTRPRNPTPSSSSSDPSSSATPPDSATPRRPRRNPSPTSDDEDDGDDEDDDALAHIPANHRLALPFWLAETLAERSLVTMHMPHCFKPTIRHALRADAPSVNLHRLCASYYALGIRVAALVNDVALPAALARAFADRCWRIVDQAAFASDKGSRAIGNLDRTERRLFFAAHAMNTAVTTWKERKADRIVAFQPLLGKRSHASIEAGDRAKDVNAPDEAGSPITPRSTSRLRVQ